MSAANPTGIATPYPAPRTLSQVARGNDSVGIGDSIMRGLAGTNLYGRTSWFDMACLFSGQRIRRLANLGVDGETSAQVLARIGDVIALRPARCVVGVGTNDVIGGVSLTTTMANIRAICARLRAAGIEPILATILPIYLPAFETTYQTATSKLNWAIADYAAAQGLICLDLHSLVVDGVAGTGDFVSGYDSDGEHLTPVGARVVGAKVANILAPTYPNVVPYLGQLKTDAANLLTNGIFSGDSNADGLADNWGTSGTGTPTYSLEAGTDGVVGNWQVLTYGSAGQNLLQRTINPSSSWAGGDVIEFSGRIRATIEAGGMWAYCTLSFYSAGPVEIGSAKLKPIENWMSDIADGVFTMRTTIPANCVLMQLNAGNSPTGTGVLKFSQLTIRNLTKLGLV
jgi:lysophospholipase L1-like esterase